MQLKCIAIDDEPLALEIIKGYAAKFHSIQLVQTFDDAVTASEFVNNTHIDLIFIDINMPDISGIDLVRSLKEKPMIIFTTAYKKFAFEGFELDAIDYLLKPISLDRFTKAVEKAMEYAKYKKAATIEQQSDLFVRSEYKLVRIPVADIEYIEGLEDYIRIHLTTGKPVMTLMTMKGVLEKLPVDGFKRIHRSYIISLKSIRALQSKKVMLNSGKELSVSDSYTADLTEWVRKHR